ncbi:MAG: 50S ribosomal protein L22 [Clostridia bacterium]
MEELVEEKKAIAQLRHERISARKVKIVIDLIRGKNAKEAIAILKYTNKAAAPLIEKLLKSAIANAVNNNGMDETLLYIAEIYANQGPTLKRIMPKAKGTADRIRKRSSHTVIVLKEA